MSVFAKLILCVSVAVDPCMQWCAQEPGPVTMETRSKRSDGHTPRMGKKACAHLSESSESNRKNVHFFYFWSLLAALFFVHLMSCRQQQWRWWTEWWGWGGWLGQTGVYSSSCLFVFQARGWEEEDPPSSGTEVCVSSIISAFWIPVQLYLPASRPHRWRSLPWWPWCPTCWVFWSSTPTSSSSSSKLINTEFSWRGIVFSTDVRWRPYGPRIASASETRTTS